MSVTEISANLSSNETSSTTKDFEFNHRLLMNVLAYSVMFIIGTIGNSVVLLAAHRQHASPENYGRTNVHMMVLHLTIADIIVCDVVIPLEISWRLSVQWYAGNVACKLLMFVRGFAFYLSSTILVCLSLDRFLAISRPLASLKKSGDVTRKRGKIMILSAWILSAVFALPQTLVFRVLKHPERNFLQCTTMNYFEEMFQNSSTNSTHFMSANMAEKMYSSLFLVAVYMVPLLVIIVTYVNILYRIFVKSHSQPGLEIIDDETPPPPLLRWRTSHIRSVRQPPTCSTTTTITTINATNRNETNEMSLQLPPCDDKTDSICLRRNRSARQGKVHPRRSQNVALRMSILHVLTFVTCWTPYLIITLWHIIDGSGVAVVPPEVQDALFLTAVFNSCLNPLVYGGCYFKALTRRSLLSKNSSRQHHSITYHHRLSSRILRQGRTIESTV